MAKLSGRLGRLKPIRPSQPKQPDPVWLRMGRGSLAVVGALLVCGLLLMFTQPEWTAALIWALGLSATGMFLGFLFGLPRPGAPVPPPPPPAQTPPGSSQETGATPATPATLPAMPQATWRAPDALLEIADWLTKIIVGLGLVNLKDAPELLERLATTISHSLAPAWLERLITRFEEARKPLTGVPVPVIPRDPASGATQTLMTIVEQKEVLSPLYSFAMGMIVFFIFVGLLVGYLTTRMYLQTALLRGDREARQEALALDPIGTSQALQYQESKRIASEIAGDHGLRGDSGPPAAHVVQQLADINARYQRVEIPDYRLRVAEKNTLMQRMFAVVMNNRVSPAWLLAQEGDGYLHTVATAILANPTVADTETFLERAFAAIQKHTQYRVVEAVQRLCDASSLTRPQLALVQQLLERYAASADVHLFARIEETRKCLAALEVRRAQAPRPVEGGRDDAGEKEQPEGTEDPP